MTKSFFLLIILILALGLPTYAGGSQVNLHNHKNTGMGLIGTSLNADASATFYNPGALVTIPQTYNFMTGLSGIRNITKFHLKHPSIYQAITDNPTWTPFYIYASARVSENWAFGLAVNTPYGNKTDWEEGWAGRFLINEISIYTNTVQPSVSYQITEQISIGVGFVFALGSLDLTRNLPVQNSEGEGKLNIKGNTTGYGFNTGVFFSPNDQLNLGVSYRSEISMELEDADAIIQVPQMVESFFPAENSVSSSFPIPANMDFGISYNLQDNLMIGLALNYVFWSSYKSLDFDFQTNTAELKDIVSPRKYSNTLIVRAGGSYKVSKNLFFRAGSYYEPSPVHENYFSPKTPTLTNIGFTGGLSFLPIQSLSIDASLLYIFGLERKAGFTPGNFEGYYKSNTFISGIGISYSI